MLSVVPFLARKVKRARLGSVGRTAAHHVGTGPTYFTCNRGVGQGRSDEGIYRYIYPPFIFYVVVLSP